jgi:GTPase SAR1 family protein
MKARTGQRIAVFVVGPPGAGKTTIVRGLLARCFPSPVLHASPKWTLAPDLFHDHGVCLAGHYTGATFDGADTVPYNGVAAALDYWRDKLLEHYRVTIFDGDRFSHASALATVRKHAHAKVFHVDADAETLTKYRAARGSNQATAWMKGRETKALKFAREFKLSDLEAVDQSVPLEESIDALQIIAEIGP